ncbi:MAG: lytic transglycosylase domain-containing protein [Chloroflexi bacterium]|nr:MAG: lytic transglycosylase domain-containing protein [Chloroflexota bacterium]TME47356.1 MAG: lytic transglycosylase domain-containing protein [Chloroflexota bacterium]
MSPRSAEDPASFLSLVLLGLSLLDDHMVSFHGRMSSKKRKGVNSALLGAAATALAVKGALTGPIAPVAQPPLEGAANGLAATGASALATSGRLASETETKLAGIVAGRGPLADPSQPAAKPKTPPAPTGNDSARSTGRTVQVIDPDTPGGVNRRYPRALVLRILHEAAVRHGIDPKLVLALSYWESGWNQARVSATGAVGLMQIEPDSAREAGPALLGRPVDISDPYDNADVGAAILRDDLDHYQDPAMALAAYYQGGTSLAQNGMLPDTQQYVQGILDLAARVSG